MSISSRRMIRKQKSSLPTPPIQPGNVTVTVNGSSITVSGTITTTQSTTFSGLNISVARDQTGYPWVFSTAINNGQVVNGTFTLNGTQSGIADGNYVAYVSYSTDGQATWITGPQASFTIGAVSNPVPNAPTNLTVTSTSTSAIGLSWTAPTGTVTGYNIYRNGTLITSSPITSTSYTSTGLSAQTSYTYEVRAVNTGGEGNGATISTATATSNPGSIYPGPVTASISGATISLSGTLTTSQATILRANISIALDETNYPWIQSVGAVNDGSVNGALQLSGTTSLATGNYVAYVSYSTDSGANWTIGTRTKFAVTATNPGGVTAPVVAIYRKIWSSDPPIDQVPTNATEIRLSFLQGDPPSLVGYTTDGQSTFLNKLAQRRQSGQTILGSLGGAGGGLNPSNRNSFLQGIANVKNLLSSVPGGGLDGIDWDIESGSSFPTADAVYLSSRLKELYGNSFIISMAPNGSNKVAYRQAAAQMQTAGCLDWIAQQFYDAPVTLGQAKTEIQNYINAGIPAYKNGVGMYVSSNPSKGWTLQQCTNYMNDIRNTWPEINKVYLWTEGGDIPNAISWTNAMRPIVGL